MFWLCLAVYARRVFWQAEAAHVSHLSLNQQCSQFVAGHTTVQNTAVNAWLVKTVLVNQADTSAHHDLLKMRCTALSYGQAATTCVSARATLEACTNLPSH